MWKVMMTYTALGERRTIEMPGNNGLGLFKACHFADLYKERNPKAMFTVVNEDNGDIEYQV